MKISVITVSLNAVNTIEQTIRSLLFQQTNGRFELEYILIDGGSTDGTLDLIEKYSDQITFWCSEPDRGIYDAMNKGLRNATGDVIGFLNADDWYENGTLLAVYESFFRNDEIKIFSGGVRFVDEHGDEIKKDVYRGMDPWKGMVWAHPGIFAKKEVFDRIGVFDTKYRICADYKWLLSCYASGIAFVYTDRILANFRTTGISSKCEGLVLAREQYAIKLEVSELYISSETEKRRILEETEAKLSYVEWCAHKNEGADDLTKMLIANYPKAEQGVYLWGYGHLGKELYRLLKEAGIPIKGVIDNDIAKEGVTIEAGTEVCSPKSVMQEKAPVLVGVLYADEKLKKQIGSIFFGDVIMATDLMRGLR